MGIPYSRESPPMGAASYFLTKQGGGRSFECNCMSNRKNNYIGDSMDALLSMVIASTIHMPIVSTIATKILVIKYHGQRLATASMARATIFL